MADTRVLVAEDDQGIRSLLIDYLTSELGVSVLVASHGAEALEVATRERPHLIRLDMGMPGLGGANTCRRLKADPATRGIAVVALSASPLGEEAGEAGCADFLAKPFDLDDVGEVVRRWLPVD